jgi:hypothetical protein
MAAAVVMPIGNKRESVTPTVPLFVLMGTCSIIRQV